MNKKILIPPTILMLIIFGLGGCNELGFGDDKQSDDTDKVEIVDYKIETYKGKIEGCCPKYEKAADGFVYNLTYKYGYYRIIGKIKNNSGKMLSDIFIIVKFYDKNGSYLLTKTDGIFNLPNTFTEDFEIRLQKDTKYFENIDNIKFEIEVS